MAQTPAKVPLLFRPDRVYVHSTANELLIAGEGHTIRVPLDLFIDLAPWPLILPKVKLHQDQQDADRRATFNG
jgi:hypothetical protein